MHSYTQRSRKITKKRQVITPRHGRTRIVHNEKERESTLPPASRSRALATSLPILPAPTAALEALVCQVAADEQGLCDWEEMSFRLVGEDGAGWLLALSSGFLGSSVTAVGFDLSLLFDYLAQLVVVGCDLGAEEGGGGVCGLESFHDGDTGRVWNVRELGWVDRDYLWIEVRRRFGEEGDDVEGFAVRNG